MFLIVYYNNYYSDENNKNHIDEIKTFIQKKTKIKSFILITKENHFDYDYNTDFNNNIEGIVICNNFNLSLTKLYKMYNVKVMTLEYLYIQAYANNNYFNINENLLFILNNHPDFMKFLYVSSKNKNEKEIDDYFNKIFIELSNNNNKITNKYDNFLILSNTNDIKEKFIQDISNDPTFNINEITDFKSKLINLFNYKFKIHYSPQLITTKMLTPYNVFDLMIYDYAIKMQYILYIIDMNKLSRHDLLTVFLMIYYIRKMTSKNNDKIKKIVILFVSQDKQSMQGARNFTEDLTTLVGNNIPKFNIMNNLIFSNFLVGDRLNKKEISMLISTITNQKVCHFNLNVNENDLKAINLIEENYMIHSKIKSKYGIIRYTIESINGYIDKILYKYLVSNDLTDSYDTKYIN